MVFMNGINWYDSFPNAITCIILFPSISYNNYSLNKQLEDKIL